jgi:tetratricopeptide (TPR) repeat protein
VALAAWLAAASASAADDRLERADGLLGSAEGYPEAIALYREVLAETTARAGVRLRLARVLAWSGDLDASIIELDALVETTPNDVGLRVERGEVLSWKGDYTRALADLEGVLREDPGQARAARGIARIHRWSGRMRAADRAYARALELEDDGEARAEWEAMLRPYRPRAGIETTYFSDSSDFDRRSVRMTYSGFQDIETRVSASLARIDIGHSQDQVPAAIASRRDTDRALELALRLDGTLDAGPRMTLELGGQDWELADTALFARGHVEVQKPWLGALALHVVHEGFGGLSSSFEAVQNDVDYTGVAASLYRQVTQRVGLYGRLEAGAISDSNSRQSLHGSASYQPSTARELSLSLGLSHSRYADASPLYYSPESDTGVEVGLRHRMPLGSRLSLEYAGALGYNDTDERMVSEAGTQWSAEAGVTWDGPVWAIALEYRVSYSQRSSRYHYSQGLLRIERRF